MDADERALFGEAITAVLTRNPGDGALAVLTDEGWDDVRADDEPFALGALFEAAGAHLATAPLFDLALAPLVPGVRPAVSARQGEDGFDLIAIGAPDGASRLLFLGVDGPVLVPVDRLDVTPVSGIDPDLAVHRYRGEGAGVAVPEVDPAAVRALLRRCAAHQLVGLAERAERAVTRHVLVREQFGRAIGSWQTVQHRLADVRVEITAARAALGSAWADPQPVISAAAKVQATVAADAAAAHAQQLLGAIGFTWEHDIHLVVRRIAVLDTAFGSRPELTDEIADHLLTESDWEPSHVDL